MRIKMISTRRGWPDGFTSVRYTEGKEYDVPHTLACQFLNGGHAINAEPEETTSEPVETSGEQVIGALARANIDFNRIFRPQPTRGSAPTNPATLLDKGEVL